MYFGLFAYAWCSQFYVRRTRVVYDVMVSACEDMSKGAVAPIHNSEHWFDNCVVSMQETPLAGLLNNPWKTRCY